MDWLLLLLLIPAVMVPTVLLYGFAGCHIVFGISTIYPPTAPKNLTAAPVASVDAGSAVTLTWENTDGTEAQIERAMDGGDFTPLPDPSDPTKVLVVNGESFIDTGLSPGATFLYQVRTNKSGATSDDATNTVTVTTFKTAFYVPITDVIASTDQPGDKGYTVIQILASTLLQASGTLVNLTLRGPTGGLLTLDTIFISNVAATGDPFDSDVPPVPVTSNLALNNATLAIAPAGTFFLDQSKPLLVAYDVNPTANTMRYGTLPQGGASAYAKAPTVPGTDLGEAGVMNRTPPYGTSNILFLIQKIEVM